MSYLVRYQYNDGPEALFEIDDLPESEYELRVKIQESIDSAIIVYGSTSSQWHAVHSEFVKIIEVKPKA